MIVVVDPATARAARRRLRSVLRRLACAAHAAKPSTVRGCRHLVADAEALAGLDIVDGSADGRRLASPPLPVGSAAAALR